MQTIVEILGKLPSRGLSAKLNLGLGHLSVSEDGDLAFADQGNINTDGITRT